MLPHNLTTRPLLVEAGSEIRIELENKKSILSFDSHENLSLKGKSIVRVYKAKSTICITILVVFGEIRVSGLPRRAGLTRSGRCL